MYFIITQSTLCHHTLRYINILFLSTCLFGNRIAFCYINDYLLWGSRLRHKRIQKCLILLSGLAKSPDHSCIFHITFQSLNAFYQTLPPPA